MANKSKLIENIRSRQPGARAVCRLASRSHGSGSCEIDESHRRLSDRCGLECSDSLRKAIGLPSRAWESRKHWTDTIVAPKHEPQNQSEEVIGKFWAGVARGLGVASDRIILTNQKLLFETDHLSLDLRTLNIPLNDIALVDTWNSFSLTPGMKVQCRSGDEYKLFVSARSRKAIMDLIRQQLSLKGS